MVIQTRRFAKKDELGFTLVELLLVVALLLSLLAALIFNFSTLQKGAELEEGARQFEALVRLASAQAANSGHTVLIRFGEDSGASSSTSTNEMVDIFDIDSKLRVVWEPDPIGQPGVFVDLPEAARFVEAFETLARVDKVQVATLPMNQSTNEAAAVDTSLSMMPPIQFYPDGSTDKAEILLASHEIDDLRRVSLQLSGVTGQIRSEMRRIDLMEPVEWMGVNDANQPQADAISSTLPASAPNITTTSSSTTDFPEDEDAKLFRENSKTNAFPEP